MFVNHSLKQVTAKIVYYGPGLSGKTTNLQYIFSVTNPKTRGELVSIETEIERTLFFDLLPLNVGQVRGYQTKFQLYTVPGQIFYDSTRKLVLKGSDGIVFVVDSQELREQAGLESFENLKTNLAAYNIDLNELPLVFQFNKRDLDSASSVERLKKLYHIVDAPYFEAVATDGIGVIETLKTISGLTLKKVIKFLDQINEEHAGAAEIPSNMRINFDTNSGKEIKKFEELPVRKIPMEEIENFNKELSDPDIEVPGFDPPGKYRAHRPANQSPAGYNPAMQDEEEEVFTLGEESILPKEQDGTRVFTKDEFEKLNLINDEPAAIPSKKPQGQDGFDADDDEVFTLEASEAIDKIGNRPITEKLAYPLPDSVGVPPSSATIPNIQISGLPKPPVDAGKPQKNKPENEYATIAIKSDSFPFPNLPEEDIDSKLDALGGDFPAPVKPPAKEPQAAPPVPPQQPAPSAPPDEMPDFDLEPGQTKIFDSLKGFEDKTRIAVIRKLLLNNPYLIVDIKDKNGNLLENIEMYVNPEIKKISIILDVKKR